MARKTGGRGSGKVIIRVFCEGESEQAYTEFLKHKFSDVAVIEYPKETGLFDRASDRFAKVPQMTFSNVFEAIEFLESKES